MMHTPGPWTLDTVRTDCGVCHKVGPFPGRNERDKPRHACLYADYPSASNPADLELYANARLIAAAPELLDLAHQYLSDLRRPPTGDSLQRRIERAEAVIAKAVGEAR